MNACSFAVCFQMDRIREDIAGAVIEVDPSPLRVGSVPNFVDAGEEGGDADTAGNPDLRVTVDGLAGSKIKLPVGAFQANGLADLQVIG